MDPIKFSFQKVKEDIESMKNQIDFLTFSLLETQNKINEFNKIIQDLLIQSSFIDVQKENNTPTDIPKNPTIPTDKPTDNYPFKPQKTQNLGFSTGNEGVPTDRQTNQQTNQQTNNTYFGQAIEVINSLDSIKKEIKNKFKKITEQEFLVFSTIYQISEKQEYTDYKTLSEKLNLTESSIRDYIRKLMKKGIPIKKSRINNKIIQLSISEDLKKIVSLPTILQLRES